MHLVFIIVMVNNNFCIYSQVFHTFSFISHLSQHSFFPVFLLISGLNIFSVSTIMTYCNVLTSFQKLEVFVILHCLYLLFLLFVLLFTDFFLFPYFLLSFYINLRYIHIPSLFDEILRYKFNFKKIRDVRKLYCV